MTERLKNIEIKNSELVEELTGKRSTVIEKVELVKESGVFFEMSREVIDILIEKIFVYGGKRIKIIWKHKFL